MYYMTKIKLYLKSKEFLISMSIITLFSLLNIYAFLKNTYLGDGAFLDGVNRFSFWNYVLHYNFGSILMFLSSFIICILSLNKFYNEINGSFLKNQLLRENYNKVMIKKVIFCYIRSYIPFILNSIFVFLLGSILFSDSIPNTIYANPYINFKYYGILNPYLYCLLNSLSLLLYVIMVTNIGLIVLKITKKMSVSAVVTFVSINALNFIIGNLSIIIAKIIGSESMINYAYNINIYEGYFVQSTVLRALLHTGIMVIVTLCILFVKYKNKEKVVLDFE